MSNDLYKTVDWDSKEHKLLHGYDNTCIFIYIGRTPDLCDMELGGWGENEDVIKVYPTELEFGWLPYHIHAPF